MLFLTWRIIYEDFGNGSTALATPPSDDEAWQGPQPRDCHLVNSTVKHWNTYKSVLSLKFVHIPYHTSRSMWVRVWFFMAHRMILESMSDHQVYAAASHQLARSSNVRDSSFDFPKTISRTSRTSTSPQRQLPISLNCTVTDNCMRLPN